MNSITNHAKGSSPLPDLTIYYHSMILYWWPVWLVGFIMAIGCYFENDHVVFVHGEPREVRVEDNRLEAPAGEALEKPSLHMHRSTIPGFVFVATLLWVMLICSTTVRGWLAVWHVTLIVALIALFGWIASYLYHARSVDLWSAAFAVSTSVSIHLSLGAYLAISGPVFVIWFARVFFLDRYRYLTISAGQVRVRNAFFEEEEAYDVVGINFHILKFDVFRMLVGGGIIRRPAGDLVFRIAGASPRTLEVPNVVDVYRKKKLIEERLATREVE